MTVLSRLAGIALALPRLTAIGLVQCYRFVLSPLLPRACRFEPSCSAYALEALRRHGAIAGGCLAIRRILRCHPWGGQGYDPVPERAPHDAPPPRTTRSHRHRSHPHC
ncbi:MAG: membrane protein insertion efficiency factor YidD [Alphaproteobacteria bacterium]|nr:membrane protein insertion efficiency factor YidD [Alphaproteobacteria bacterium]